VAAPWQGGSPYNSAAQQHVRRLFPPPLPHSEPEVGPDSDQPQAGPITDDLPPTDERAPYPDHGPK
jgi:hypothetical protein